jgi:predicted TIM-barrel fold metal-dependent hydrolase
MSLGVRGTSEDAPPFHFLIVQTKVIGRLPNAPVIMGHIGVPVAKRPEGILYSI